MRGIAVSYFLRFSLSKLLPLVIVSLAFLAAVITAVISFISAQNALIDETEVKLSGLAVAKSQSIQSLFDQATFDLKLIARNPATMAMLDDFSVGWNFLSVQDKTAALQDIYITQNTFPVYHTGLGHDLEVLVVGMLRDARGARTVR